MSESNPHVLAELSSYLDHTLSPAESKRVDAHLKGCGSCNRHYMQLRTLRQMLQSGPTFTPPESFYQNVLRRIEKPARAPGLSFVWGLPSKAIASACLVMLVIWISHDARKAKAPEQRPPVSSNETEKGRREAAAPAVPAVPAEPSSTADREETDKNKRALEAHLETTATKPLGPMQAADQTASPTALADRKDIVVQARNINGPASQNSFAASQQYLAERKKTAPVDGVTAPVLSVQGELAGGAKTTAKKKAAGKALDLLPEWKGITSGVTDPRNVIIETPEAWQTLWRQHTSTAAVPIPEVDFNRFLIVGVFAGQKPSGGYSISIVETRPSANALTILYQETSLPSMANAPSGTTQPFNLKVLPKSGLLIQFKRL